jgi:ribosomal-protein-alanine N-acetyltransferase
MPFPSCIYFIVKNNIRVEEIVIVSIETERLIIRKFESTDWKDLYEYLSLPEVLRYEPDGISDESDCKNKTLERSKSDIFWAVCLKDSGKMIGHLYFAPTEPAEFLTWEIGYIFSPAYYGKGYATEACRRILQYGFAELRIHRIIGMCNPENSASWKLLERLAMRREGHFKQKAFFRKTADNKPIWHDAYLYAILAEEWRRN